MRITKQKILRFAPAASGQEKSYVMEESLKAQGEEEMNGSTHNSPPTGKPPHYLFNLDCHSKLLFVIVLDPIS